MTIPTLKNKHIAIVLGVPASASQLEDMLRAGVPTVRIAAVFGTSEKRLQQLLDGPDPLPERPMNWAPSAGAVAAPFLPWFGLTPIAWSGTDGAYTFGPPVFSESVLTVAPYPTPDRPCKPVNWYSLNIGLFPFALQLGDLTRPAWHGMTTIPYAGPPASDAGFTFGPPVF